VAASRAQDRRPQPIRTVLFSKSMSKLGRDVKFVISRLGAGPDAGSRNARSQDLFGGSPEPVGVRVTAVAKKP
jgi:hypothetical protein